MGDSRDRQDHDDGQDQAAQDRQIVHLRGVAAADHAGHVLAGVAEVDLQEHMWRQGEIGDEKRREADAGRAEQVADRRGIQRRQPHQDLQPELVAQDRALNGGERWPRGEGALDPLVQEPAREGVLQRGGQEVAREHRGHAPRHSEQRTGGDGEQGFRQQQRGSQGEHDDQRNDAPRAKLGDPRFERPEVVLDLVAGVSVASIVLGVAAQSTLGNAVAGLALLAYRPFRVGHRIQVQAPGGPETGVVESVTLGYTVLRTFDNRRVVLPNSLAGTQTTVNLTSIDPRVMTAIDVGVSYTADVARAREILLEIASAHPDVSEVVDCPLVELASSSVYLRVRVWCHDPLAAHRFEYDLYEQAKLPFAEAGIEIPYPYQNVVVTDRRDAVA